MARPPQPWRRRDSSGAWHCQVRGAQVYLAPATATKTEAREALTRYLAELGQPDPAPRRPPKRPVLPAGLATSAVLDWFLDDTEKRVARGELAPVTLEGYDRYLSGAIEAIGAVPAADLKPHHVQAWIDARGDAWNATSRYNAITAVKTAFSWAKQVGRIPENPIAGMKRPTPLRREIILSGDQFRAVLAAVPDQEFRDLWTGIGLTGCRPGEVYGMTAARFNREAGTWSVPNKTRAKTGERLRTVYLTPVAAELSARLAARHPAGPLFRNLAGTAWTRHTVARRLERLADRLKMGREAVAYSLGHLYITDALLVQVSRFSIRSYSQA